MALNELARTAPDSPSADEAMRVRPHMRRGGSSGALTSRRRAAPRHSARNSLGCRATRPIRMPAILLQRSRNWRNGHVSWRSRHARVGGRCSSKAVRCRLRHTGHGPPGSKAARLRNIQRPSSGRCSMQRTARSGPGRKRSALAPFAFPIQIGPSHLPRAEIVQII